MTTPVPSVDLRPDHWAIVRRALRCHVPDREVLAFGSRATWTAKDYSDLDLAVMGEEPLSLRTVSALDEALGESDLPFKVDVVDWARIDDGFRSIIRRGGVVVQAAEGTPTGIGPAQQSSTANGKSLDASSQLSVHAEIVMGQSPPGNKSNNIGEGIPLLNGPTEFGSHHPEPTQYTTDVRKAACPGDLLFCVRGSTTGRMNWADQDYAIGRGIAAIRHKRGRQYQPFVRAVIEYSLPSLLKQATGSTFPNVSARQLAGVSWPPLELPEQRAIAHVLGTLDDKIELNRRMNETLEAMARALFKSWFVDFDPVRAKMEGRDTGLPQDIADLFPDRLVDSEMGEIPEGWAVGHLADAIELLSGGTPRTTVAEYWNGGIPWYTPRDAPNQSDMFVLDTQRTITQVGVDNSATKVLPSRTTVISARGTVGRLACLGRAMAMNQTCYGIRGAGGYSDFFVYWLVRNAVEDLRSRTHGTVFDTITRQTFTFIDWQLPPRDVAGAFEAAVKATMERVLSNLHESRILAALRDTLLPKLISGEIRVPDAARALESAT